MCSWHYWWIHFGQRFVMRCHWFLQDFEPCQWPALDISCLLLCHLIWFFLKTLTVFVRLMLKFLFTGNILLPDNSSYCYSCSSLNEWLIFAHRTVILYLSSMNWLETVSWCFVARVTMCRGKYPFDSKSDENLISPYSITPESHFKVTIIKEMFAYRKSSWLLYKFSLAAPWEI